MSTNIENTDLYPEKTVFIFDAAESMMLSKDVHLPDGTLIASKNTVLDYTLISKMSDYHILEIDVYDTSKSVVESNSDQLSYREKIQNTETFIRFKKEYDSTVLDVESELNNIIINNKNIDTTALLQNTATIFAEHSNTLEMFDMIHSIREVDDLTYAHCVNVSLISGIMGKWLGYSDEDINVLILCGLLHDIGKISIPNEILSKPTRLTVNEYQIMKKHVNLGYDRIKDSNIDSRIKEACLLHHEKCDGSGYPLGLTSEKIPDFAKIVTIADMYDAMTAKRVYRGPLCPFEVVRILGEEAYTKLDPKFSIPFLKNVVNSYINNDVKLSDGQIGRVKLINDNDLSRPIVQCGEEFINLSKQRDITIIEIL